MLCLQPTDILKRFSLFGSLRCINNYHNIVGIMVESFYLSGIKVDYVMI